MTPTATGPTEEASYTAHPEGAPLDRDPRPASQRWKEASWAPARRGLEQDLRLERLPFAGRRGLEDLRRMEGLASPRSITLASSGQYSDARIRVGPGYQATQIPALSKPPASNGHASDARVGKPVWRPTRLKVATVDSFLAKARELVAPTGTPDDATLAHLHSCSYNTKPALHQLRQDHARRLFPGPDVVPLLSPHAATNRTRLSTLFVQNPIPQLHLTRHFSETHPQDPHRARPRNSLLRCVVGSIISKRYWYKLGRGFSALQPRVLRGSGSGVQTQPVPLATR